jgi:4-amino-4-deoxy-L-arabinose transferase-like glycosyltransferase
MKKIGDFVKKENIPTIVLTLLILFHIFVNINYAIKNDMPTAWDESWHTAISFEKYLDLTGHQVNLDNYPLLKERSLRYPQLIHWTPAPFYFLFGLTQDVGAFSITIYLILLIIFTYLIGKEIYDKKVGLIAAILVSFYPLAYGLSRLFLLDLPVAAMLTATVYFLVKYQKTKRHRHILPILVCIALGALTKQTYLVFVALPLTYMIMRTNKEKILNAFHGKRKYYSMGLTLIFLTTAIIYFLRLSGPYLLGIFLRGLSWDTFTIGIKEIWLARIAQIPRLILVLTAISLVFYKKLSEKTLFLLWIFIPIIFVAATGIPTGGRYLVPIIPAVSILSTWLILQIKRPLITCTVLAIILGQLLFTFAGLTYGDKNLNAYGVSIHSPQNIDWKIEEILRTVNRTNPNAKVFIAFNLQNFNAHSFAVEAIREQYNLTLDYYFNNISKPEIILLKTGVRSVDITFNEVYQYAINKNLKIINSTRLPDGTDLLIASNKI